MGARQCEAVDSLESLDPDDKVVFNDRRVPCTVVNGGEMEKYEGSIYVEYHVILKGPAGADIYLQRTGTGRLRVKESAPWGAYANVQSLYQVV